jgi:hypothetical protein
MAKTIETGAFKAKCLQLIDEVARTGEPKRGKPVARLMPMATRPGSPFGFMKHRVRIVGDVMAPLDAEWDALR